MGRLLDILFAALCDIFVSEGCQRDCSCTAHWTFWRRNTTTDIRAYVASGIPLERIFMIGPHGGKAGTVKIENFTDHIPVSILLNIVQGPTSVARVCAVLFLKAVRGLLDPG